MSEENLIERNLLGRHFRVTGRELVIFGRTARINPDGTVALAIKRETRGGELGNESLFSILDKIEPKRIFNPAKPQIEWLIGKDVAKGIAHKISYLLVDDHIAASMWCEGIINAGHFVSAIEDTMSVTLPGVNIAGLSLPVRIAPEELIILIADIETPMATMTADHRVV